MLEQSQLAPYYVLRGTSSHGASYPAHTVRITSLRCHVGGGDRPAGLEARLNIGSGYGVSIKKLATSGSSLRDMMPLRRFYEKHPRLQPLTREIYGLMIGRPPPHFFGWLMSTDHEHPWDDEHRWSDFRRAAEEVKHLSFSWRMSERELDALRWRHWLVSYSVSHAVSHVGARDFRAVECGVADGLTAYFALTELEAALVEQRVDSYHFDLYDAWGAMRADLLLKGEEPGIDYSLLELRRTRDNLERFSAHTDFHVGYLPESLGEPGHVSYLHIDLNAAQPTIGVLEGLWSQLSSGSVVLLDDYGWRTYRATKLAVDQFFADKPGSLLKFPTGQAAYIC